MASRETRLLRIENQCKFDSIEDAAAEANAIYGFAKRMVEENEWACKMMIGISENDPRYSAIETIKTGNRGRPVRHFVPKSKRKKMKQIKPHLHIILCGNPAETIARPIVSNINRRYRRKNLCDDVVSRKFPIYGERGRYIHYVLEQSTKTRYLDNDPSKLLENFDFRAEYDYYHSRFQ